VASILDEERNNKKFSLFCKFIASVDRTTWIHVKNVPTIITILLLRFKESHLTIFDINLHYIRKLSRYAKLVIREME